PRLLQRLAGFQERLGKLKDAEASLRQLVSMDVVNPSHRISLAALLQKTGRSEEAIQILNESRDSHGEVRLAELYLQAGRTEEALALCYRATPSQLSAMMIRLIPRMLQHAELSQGRSVLQVALERMTEPSSALQLRMKLAESFDPATERPLLERELRRIRRLASQDASQQDGYFDWLQRQAVPLKIEAQVREELRQAWENGTGSKGAGIALCILHLKQPAIVEPILLQVLERRDLNLPEVDRLIAVFESAGQWEWLAKAQQRAAEMNATDDDRLLAWIRTLHKTHGTERARAAFDRWSARFWLSEDSAAAGGEMYVELGAHEEARALLLHAIRHDPFGRNPRARVQLARLKRLQGDLSGARSLLIEAHRDARQQDFTELIEWLSAAGKLATYEQELAAFSLGEHQRLLLRQALWRHYAAQRNAPAAFALLNQHPAIYTVELSTTFREFTRGTKSFAEAATFLEQQPDADEASSHHRSDLARVFFDWSEAEGTADLSRLERATQLDPAFEDAVMSLAREYVKRAQSAKAVALLERFLAVSTAQKGREAARALLREAKLSAAGA
ncbi:MAG: hypothetical protein ACO1QR_12895, partial [Chthoniobacteraceae bacterium]